MALLFLFLDGVGLGEENPHVNPLVAAPMPTLRALLDGHVPTLAHPHIQTPRAHAFATDALLGVPGTPQSATGQATILTGKNVPALLREHYGPRPDARIRPLLEEDTLFHALRRKGHGIAFANAYPDRYFARMNRGHRVPGAMPYAARAAGIPLRTREDLARGRAISVDFTNEGWRDMLGDEDIPLRTPEESGAIVARLMDKHDLVFIDQWVPDMLGHRGDWEGALRFLAHLDRFLQGVLEHVDLARDTIFITSDHGNLEDMRVTRHTRNPVLTVVIGRGAHDPRLPLERLDMLRGWVESLIDAGQ